MWTSPKNPNTLLTTFENREFFFFTYRTILLDSPLNTFDSDKQRSLYLYLNRPTNLSFVSVLYINVIYLRKS